ncbi:MAG: hypothetical protein M3352_09885 [Bacteroidota bacterium]|nr:hypothetical protein [Bacteroidota bacterium]
MKDSFAIKNLKEFVIDSNIQSSYRIFNKIKNKQIDSAISYGTHYLYSWQQRDSAFIEFTTIIDDGEHGLRIVYFVFDKKDSMLSTTQVANKGGEGGIIYETLSQFKSKDTLFHIRSASTWLNLTNPTPWPKNSHSKGDSTFHYIIFQEDGRTFEKKFAEKKELNLD